MNTMTSPHGWPIVSLTTDFGTDDHYVAAVKATLLSRTPRLHIVDVTHHVPAHDVAAGAWIVLNAAPAFPAGTVHLAVVDPGVGTARRPIAVAAGGHLFVGPDNGLFSYVLENDPAARVIALTRVPAPASGVSPVFHGRDLFAPAAALLAEGASPDSLGDKVSDPVRLDLPRPLPAPGGALRARVAHVDHFGNVVLYVTRAALEAWLHGAPPAGLVARAGSARVTRLVSTYGDAPAGEPVMIVNSSGFLELGVNQGRAADLLGLRAGDPVDLQTETR